MREMILNHASVLAPRSDRRDISEWLKEITRGMSLLVLSKVVEKSLRTARNAYETECQPGYSLFDAYESLRLSGFRDEYRFLMGLASKTPLLANVDENARGRFLACRELTLPGEDGEPLVLCAKFDGVAVGFPSARIWDSDRVPVEFEELLPDDTIMKASEEADQLTRMGHAQPICDRYRERLRAGSDPSEFWRNRAAIFPRLIFGPDVEHNLIRSAGQFSTIMDKLAGIDRAAQEWSANTELQWRSKVTDESKSVMQDPRLRDRRMFRSQQSGKKELFTWHARYGDSGRIHLRICRSTWKVEIGYIGPHR